MASQSLTEEEAASPLLPPSLGWEGVKFCPSELRTGSRVLSLSVLPLRDPHLSLVSLNVCV